MFKWPIVLIALVAYSCSSTKPISEGKENRPLWVNDPAEFCGEEKLCAVGEGKNFTVAEIEARKNLAKVFRVSVSGATEVEETTSSISSADDLTSSGVKQEVLIQTREAVDEVLEGVVTSRKHQEDDSSFALAELEKGTAIRLMRPRMKELDAEIEQIYQSGRRSLLPRAFDLDDARAQLKNYFAVLGVPNFSSGVDRKELLQLKHKFDQNPVVIKIVNSGEWDEVEKTLQGELASFGYKITQKGAYNILLKLDSKIKREYLNVKGFERYHVMIELTALDKEDKTLGNLVYERGENGRSLNQIRARVLTDFRNDFAENFPSLHLD